MLINLFQTVRSSGVPCTLRELLDLLGALEKQMVFANIDDFYYLSRAILVKDEKHYDKFDKAFEIYFRGMEKLEDVFQALSSNKCQRMSSNYCSHGLRPRWRPFRFVANPAELHAQI